MTAKEAAIDLIKTYVLRGETISQLKSGQQGAWITDYHASIGGFIDGKRYDTNHIIVFHLMGKEINQVFKLKDIYDTIKSPQTTLL